MRPWLLLLAAASWVALPAHAEEGDGSAPAGGDEAQGESQGTPQEDAGGDSDDEAAPPDDLPDTLEVAPGEPEVPPGERVFGAADDPGPGFDETEAQPAPELDDKLLRFLRPTRARLPQNPYAQTDFTAYTLEWGEVKLGLGSVTVGVLPRVQLGSRPILDVLGLYNGSIKVDAVRAGPVDLAPVASVFLLPLGPDFLGTWFSAGGLVSWRVLDPFSVHASGWYARIGASGTPDLSRLSPFLDTIAGTEVDLSSVEESLTTDLEVGSAWARLAMDWRLNRRDSFVLQAQAALWTGSSGQTELPPILGLDEALAAGTVLDTIAASYIAVLSYQASFARLEARIGYGASAVPLAFVTQAFDLSYRVGGRTRWEENRMRRGWRRDRERADQDAQAQP